MPGLCLRGFLRAACLTGCLLFGACAQPVEKSEKAPKPPAGGHADIAGLPHAAALYKKLRPGQTVALLSLHQINPDCSPRAFYDIQTVTAPQHGTMTVAHRNEYPNFSSSNSRAACNKIKLPATVIDYTAAADFSGDDFITIDIVADTGSYKRVDIPITVSP